MKGAAQRDDHASLVSRGIPSASGGKLGEKSIRTVSPVGRHAALTGQHLQTLGPYARGVVGRAGLDAAVNPIDDRSKGAFGFRKPRRGLGGRVESGRAAKQTRLDRERAGRDASRGLPLRRRGSARGWKQAVPSDLGSLLEIRGLLLQLFTGAFEHLLMLFGLIEGPRGIGELRGRADDASGHHGVLVCDQRPLGEQCRADVIARGLLLPGRVAELFRVGERGRRKRSRLPGGGLLPHPIHVVEHSEPKLARTPRRSQGEKHREGHGPHGEDGSGGSAFLGTLGATLGLGGGWPS